MDKDISGSKYTLCIGYKMRAVKRIAVIHFDKSKCAGAEVGIGSKIFRSHTRHVRTQELFVQQKIVFLLLSDR